MLNAECPISDFHNIIGAATKRFAPLKTPRQILYRYKSFNEIDFINYIESAPFHVMDIFDDVDDMAWFTSTLIRDVIDDHAPIRTKTIKSESVPYMNYCLRKAQYKRNMARNKFRIYGKSYWEENRRNRNNVVKIRKQSMRNYFIKNCSHHDKNLWSTVSPFITDKKTHGNKNILSTNKDETVLYPKCISELFNDYFSSVASGIGFDDDAESAKDAIMKHRTHPSSSKIEQNRHNG